MTSTKKKKKNENTQVEKKKNQLNSINAEQRLINDSTRTII